MADEYFAMQDRQRQPKPKPNRVAPRQPKPKKNRDPKNLNSHIKNDYYSVLAEPRSNTQSFDCIWEFSQLAFECCRDCWYKLFGLFCGCCIATAWAFQFVPVMFSHVWCLTPCNQVLKITVGHWCKWMCFLCARLCVAPCAQACSFLFHNFSYSRMTRPPTPSIFPERPKRGKLEAKAKPVKKKKEPVVKKTNKVATAPASAPTPSPIPVAAQHTGEFDDYDKEKIAKSVRRQMMLY